MKHIHNLKELLIEQLQEQYDGEKQQLEAFPKLREKSTDNGLKQIVDSHIGKTRKQMQRIVSIFSMLNRDLYGEENKGIKGLVEEALDIAKRCTDEDTRDASIVTSIQHFNHHNIASYGTLCAYAKSLDMYKIKQVLRECLEEEKQTDESLSTLAEMSINPNAIH